MEKLRHKMDCLGVSGFMLKQDQAVALLLQHRLGFLQRVGVIEVGREDVAGAF